MTSEQMTPDEMRIAVAELRGFTDIRPEAGVYEDLDTGVDYPWQNIVGTLDGERKCLPDYPNDLNAVAGVEARLTDAEYETFALHLGPLTSTRRRQYISATALQRCEALLRTAGKWRGK